MIDWNIRFGDLLVVASMGGAGIVYAFRSGRFAETVTTMQKEIRELKGPSQGPRCGSHYQACRLIDLMVRLIAKHPRQATGRPASR